MEINNFQQSKIWWLRYVQLPSLTCIQLPANDIHWELLCHMYKNEGFWLFLTSMTMLKKMRGVNLRPMVHQGFKRDYVVCTFLEQQKEDVTSLLAKKNYPCNKIIITIENTFQVHFFGLIF